MRTQMTLDKPIQDRPDTAGRTNLPQIGRFRTYRELLQIRPRRLDELAPAAETTERTARRDLTFLRDEWEWQVQYDGRTRCWHARGMMPIRALHLEPDEQLALLIAEPAVQTFGDTPLARSLHSALEQIRKSLDAPVEFQPPGVQFDLQTTRQVDVNLWRFLWTASIKREQVEILYQNAGADEARWRVIDPYWLVNQDGCWYCIAYCHIKRGLRDFAISTYRVLEHRATNAHFERDPSLTLEKHREGSFGAYRGIEPALIVLHFEPSQAIYQQERALWPREEREMDEEGGVTIRFKAPLKPSLERWVLQFGSEVKVIEPEELRGFVRRQAKGMLRD